MTSNTLQTSILNSQVYIEDTKVRQKEKVQILHNCDYDS